MGSLPAMPTAIGGSSAWIAARRAGFAQQLKDPNTRLRFAAMLMTEGTPVQTAESAMNRGLLMHEN
jgi:hypothetical protein